VAEHALRRWLQVRDTAAVGDRGRHKATPADRIPQLHARTSFFYAYTGITPAMCMRLTNVGSQYVMGFTDANKELFDGAKTYRVTLPPNIPQERFWSLTLYDNETRSMLQTPQRFPR
jgi:hypothetical protein